MTKYTLLISIVPHDKGELITGAAVEAGSFGGTVLMGRSISANSFMAAMSLGEKSTDLVYILTEEEKNAKVPLLTEEEILSISLILIFAFPGLYVNIAAKSCFLGN